MLWEWRTSRVYVSAGKTEHGLSASALWNGCSPSQLTAAAPPPKQPRSTPTRVLNHVRNHPVLGGGSQLLLPPGGVLQAQARVAGPRVGTSWQVQARMLV